MEAEKNSPAPLGFLANNALVSSVRGIYRSYSEARASLKLSNPGTVDQVSKEVLHSVFLSDFAFSGLRAEVTKCHSATPLFQVSHSITTGSQHLPPYTFAALYGSPKSFLQANVDSDLSFSGRLNYRWNSALVTKLSMQLGAMGTAFSMENHYAGSDFSASLKTLNASMLTGSITGMVMASYLQAVTPKLSLGVDTVWSRPDEVQPPDMVLAYAARYNAENWVASAHLLATGALEAAYWRKVTDKVEAGISLNLAMAGASPMAGPMMAAKKEGTVTLGAKYGYRTSVFRAQVDSTGKVACLLEKHIMPAIAITYSGELDHKTRQTKLGLAVMFESASPELLEAAEAAEKDGPPQKPSIPF